MSSKSHEWIVISDLMSGMVGVVILFLVFSVIIKETEEAKLKNTEMMLHEKSKSKVDSVMKSLSNVILRNRLSGSVKVYSDTSTITFKDGVFANGSACLTSNVVATIKEMRPFIIKFLKKNKFSTVMVQGFTNSTPIGAPVTNINKYCAVYDDNVTLSAARANAVRRLLIKNHESSLYKRIVVAAYGDSRPLPGLSPTSGANRRVNVRFLIMGTLRDH